MPRLIAGAKEVLDIIAASDLIVVFLAVAALIVVAAASIVAAGTIAVAAAVGGFNSQKGLLFAQKPPFKGGFYSF